MQVSNHSNNVVDLRIKALAYGPSRVARTFNGYFVNGFKFHTHDYGQVKKTMNSGVCVKGNCYEYDDHDFYGLLLDIVELDYLGGSDNKVVLFKCRWFDTERGFRTHPRNGMMDVKYRTHFAQNEPFILAIQASQVYYTPYPNSTREMRDWWAVCNVKARSTYNLDEATDIEQANEVFYQEDEMGITLPGTIDDEVLDVNALYLDQCEVLDQNEVANIVSHMAGNVRSVEDDEEEEEEEEDEEEDEEEEEEEEDEADDDDTEGDDDMDD